MAFIIYLLLASAALAADYPEIPPYVLPPARMAFDDGQDAMGARLFRTTTTRRQISLGGWWDFLPDPDDKGESAHYFDHFPPAETTLWVPGTWNAQPRYWQYTGAGWYRRNLDLPAGGAARLCFAGAFYRAKVWLDGALLGEHEGGYLPFAFLIRDLHKGAHTVVVRADNRLDDASLPKRNVDWFPYGGIDRPVYLEMVPEVLIERVAVNTIELTPLSARLRATVVLRNSGPPVRLPIEVFVDGRRMVAGQQEVPSGESSAALEFTLAPPRLWSPEAPELYSARAVAGADDQFTRFGVRMSAVRGSSILWNGAAIKLRGVNRHEDHPDWGSAIPAHLVRQDIEIIKRLGANAVRSHYPPADLFLDYCDQAGLLFLDEVPAWQYRREQLATPAIQEKIRGQFRAMVEKDGGHPAILTWSLGNEWPDPDQSFDAVRSLVEYARTIAGGRLITLVTGGPSVWRVHELLDVISANWAQYQWYDPITYLDRSEGAKSIGDLHRIHERYPGKPVILTEFGGAEAQGGWHNWGNVKWSEEFQARNVEDSGRYALTQDWLSGGCVWQFADARSAPERILAGRLHGWNGKGTVDAQRNPKLAYFMLQELYRRAVAAPAAGHEPVSGVAADRREPPE